MICILWWLLWYAPYLDKEFAGLFDWHKQWDMRILPWRRCSNCYTSFWIDHGQVNFPLNTHTSIRELESMWILLKPCEIRSLIQQRATFASAFSDVLVPKKAEKANSKFPTEFLRIPPPPEIPKLPLEHLWIFNLIIPCGRGCHLTIFHVKALDFCNTKSKNCWQDWVLGRSLNSRYQTLLYFSPSINSSKHK